MAKPLPLLFFLFLLWSAAVLCSAAFVSVVSAAAGLLPFLECGSGKATAAFAFPVSSVECGSALLCRFCFSRFFCGVRQCFALPLLFFLFLLHAPGLAAADSNGLEVILDVDAVGLKTVDGLYLSRGGGAFQPAGRTPAILVGDHHQAMLDRILMNIIEPGVIGTLVG